MSVLELRDGRLREHWPEPSDPLARARSMEC